MARIRIHSRWQLRLPREAFRRRERELVLRILAGWLALACLAALC